MSFTSPQPGDPRPVPAVPASPAAPHAAPHPGYAGPPQLAAPGGPRSRPSWVAWTALGLSALSFVVASSVGILYAVNSFAGESQSGNGGLFYDAGLPSWGSVDLTPSGQATERALTDSVEEALKNGIQDFDGSAEDVTDTFCEAVSAPKKDSVATCSAMVQDTDATVVLFFTDNEGSYLATLY